MATPTPVITHQTRSGWWVVSPKCLIKRPPNQPPIKEPMPMGRKAKPM
ncbi:MAG: hypothetical protein HYR59_05255 [Acidobacteria bacterium]|nr:hypothetical protein [Acidobacteriota bacterium]